MPTPVLPPRAVRFGSCTLDLSAGELYKNGIKIRLPEQPFQILRLLLQRPGELVTREEFRQHLWANDVFVDFENGLNGAVKKLRDVLGDSAEHPRYIETIPRRGYRLICPVNDASLAVAGASAVSPWWRRRWAVGLALLVPAILLAGLVALDVGGLRDLVLGSRARAPIRSLAVLPLQNLTGDPEQDYFVDGIHDELITQLAQIGALKVISRTSVLRFRETKRPLPEIARELGVQAVLEGTVRRAGNRIHLSAQLIDAGNDRHLWAQSYDREVKDIVRLQAEIARTVANELNLTLSPGEQLRLGVDRPVSPETHQLYLKGRYFWSLRTRDGLLKSLNYFRQVIEIDPNNPRGYAGLADSYAILANNTFLPARETYPRAEAAARKALQLDEGMAEAHATLGLALFHFDWDRPGAEKELRRAIELNPGYATAHQYYSDILSLWRRHDEALVEILRALELDPLSIRINENLGRNYYFARRYDEAIEALQKTVELDPSRPRGLYDRLGWAYLARGRHREAIEALQKAVDYSGGDSLSLAGLGHACAVTGNQAEARRILKELIAQSRQTYVSPVLIALIHVGLGEKREALTWLEQGLQMHDSRMSWINVDPRFDPLRADPRFHALLRRMGFPE